jgi:uncharacterized RDD family membrane protein YckC
VKVKWLKITFYFVLVLSLGFLFSTDMGMMGYQLASGGGKTVVGGSANPVSLFWAVVFIMLYVVLLQSKDFRVDMSGIPSRRRRIAAFLIDGYFVSIPLVAISSFIAIELEARRTGQFKWWFVRDYGVDSDWILVLLIFLIMALMLLYFAIPLIKGKSNTIGYYLMGLVVVDENGKAKKFPVSFAIKRSFYKVFGLIFSLFELFKEKDAQGRFWHDKRLGTRVMFSNSE